jgi:hypothetical protein
MPTAKDFLIRIIPLQAETQAKDPHVQRLGTGESSDEEGFYVVLVGTASGNPTS